MRVICWSLLAGLCAFMATLSLAHAQIVIPNINRDTVQTVPPPAGLTGQTRSGNGVKSRAITPDPRCAQLPESLRRVTPGCH